ncbi:hypothetical protein NFI96_007003 [Prochilodus magdalenae]|nr:hypothetical protein NFI96_007003 [Prochilodus magdalenae]
MSEDCIKSELDLFTVPLTQTAIEKNTYVEIPLLSAISDTGPLEFFIAGHGEDYTDLNNTLLYLCLKITKPDGSDIDDGAAVGLINYPGATIFNRSTRSTLNAKAISHIYVNCVVPPYVVFCSNMILKVQYKTQRKYIKIAEASFEHFITEVTEKFSIPLDALLKVTDETGTEVDQNVFADLTVSKDICFVIHDDSNYSATKPSSPSLTDTMSLTSSSKDSDSDVFYPVKRIRREEEMLQSSAAKDLIKEILLSKPGGTVVLKEYEDTGTICDSSRRQMVNILAAHMTETEGYFRISAFSLALIQQIDYWRISTPLLQRLLRSAREQQVVQSLDDSQDWDSDMASLYFLLHVLPPQSSGRKKTQKISACQAIDHLVMFHKSCRSLEEHIEGEGPQQPYLLASGSSKQAISNFYIVLDKKLIPCQGRTSLAAFDELFKVHFVFSLSYDESLSNMYTFLHFY